jgi:hypothetical protein
VRYIFTATTQTKILLYKGRRLRKSCYTKRGRYGGICYSACTNVEAVRHYLTTDQQVLELYTTDENSTNRLYVAFTAIGYYELPEDSTDQYDVIYITYVGNNSKYEKEAYKNEYIESITIETRSDADMESLTRYLRQYFAPSDVASQYAGSINELGLEYEYCYTIKENVD